jgi:hypothetical protein
MASSFKPLSVVNQVDSVKKLTPDATYWKNYEVGSYYHVSISIIDSVKNVSDNMLYVQFIVL